MKRAAVTGNFDGVHRGHVHLLQQLRTLARKRELQPVAITFASHPMELINPAAVTPQLTDSAERRRLIEQQGVEVIELPFTPELRAMSATEFLEKINRELGVELLLMGFNNHIGHDRRSASQLHGAPVEVTAASELPEPGVSSSAVRAALAEGNVELAAQLLGRPYAVEGTVVHGRRLGRTIGFPTANLQPAPDTALPATGVYLGRVDGHRAVVNIGHRPTVEGRDDAPLSIEAHLMDYDGDLYGRTLRAEFLARLRGEKKFGSLAELKQAIAHDIAEANGRDI